MTTLSHEPHTLSRHIDTAGKFWIASRMYCCKAGVVMICHHDCHDDLGVCWWCAVGCVDKCKMAAANPTICASSLSSSSKNRPLFSNTHHRVSGCVLWASTAVMQLPVPTVANFGFACGHVLPYTTCLVSCHDVRLDMGVLALLGSEVPMQKGTLTTDGAAHELYFVSQLGSQDATPVYKCLCKYPCTAQTQAA